MNVYGYPEWELETRRRLRELAATFPTGGAGELRGERLAAAVRTELDRLPVVAAEVWMSVHGWQLPMAVQAGTRGQPRPRRRRLAKQR